MSRHDQLLDREETAWARLWAEVGRVPAGELARPGVVGDWSVQDLVWHCARWAAFCGEHLDLRRAGSFTDPFAGESDEHWDRVNQDIAQESKAMAWADVEAGAVSARDRVRTAIVALPEVDDVAESWFADETFVHYDEHAEQIAAFADGLPG
jgi:Mycothiol maleylpyruvate isomerase N-terminal domain